MSEFKGLVGLEQLSPQVEEHLNKMTEDQHKRMDSKVVLSTKKPKEETTDIWMQIVDRGAHTTS